MGDAAQRWGGRGGLLSSFSFASSPSPFPCSEHADTQNTASPMTPGTGAASLLPPSIPRHPSSDTTTATPPLSLSRARTGTGGDPTRVNKLDAQVAVAAGAWFYSLWVFAYGMWAFAFEVTGKVQVSHTLDSSLRLFDMDTHVLASC